MSPSLKNFIKNLGNDPGGTGGEESFGLFFWSVIIRKKLGPVTRFTSQSAMFSITLFGRECGLQIHSIAQWDEDTLGNNFNAIEIEIVHCGNTDTERDILFGAVICFTTFAIQ